MSALDDALAHEERVRRRFIDDRATFAEAAKAQKAVLDAQEAEASALSRAAIAAMSVDEYEKREGEIMRWQQAGAKDGEPAPPAERPTDHTFTRDEIRGMSLDDFEKHEARIMEQMRGDGIPAKAETSDAT